MDLILASGSSSRQALLEQAGVSFRVEISGVEESSIKSSLASSPLQIASALAQEKACAVSLRFPESLVIGADQVLLFEGQIFDKPKTILEAKEHLLRLRGRTHTLLSALCCAENGRSLWTHETPCHLSMRPFGETFLENYLSRMETTLTQTVGGYAIETMGIQLFDAIEGDYFSILGLPLLPLLDFLRHRGVLAE